MARWKRRAKDTGRSPYRKGTAWALIAMPHTAVSAMAASSSVFTAVTAMR